MPAKRSRKRRPQPLAAKDKAEVTYLRRERAMAAAERIEVLFNEGDEHFPPVVEKLWRLYNDDETSVKDCIKIAETLAKFIGLKERSLAEAGIGKKGPKKVVNNNNFTQVNLSHEELQSLPPEIQEKLVTQTLVDARGGKE